MMRFRLVLALAVIVAPGSDIFMLPPLTVLVCGWLRRPARR
jgi:hypothetical protein